MTFPTWHEPVRLLEESTGPATDQQRELASTVGLALVGTWPRGVVAVLLEEYLQPLIWGGESERATDRQRAFLVELGSRVADDAGLTKRTASAWIQHHLAAEYRVPPAPCPGAQRRGDQADALAASGD